MNYKPVIAQETNWRSHPHAQQRLDLLDQLQAPQRTAQGREHVQSGLVALRIVQMTPQLHEKVADLVAGHVDTVEVLVSGQGHLARFLKVREQAYVIK